MNIYNRLISLLPATRVDVGTVIQVYADGALVQLQTGGFVRVLGANPVVGNRVFIRSGQILSDAPNLSGTTIEI